jgi:hypothetical protein
MSSENLTFNTFDLGILNDIEKSAGDLYDEIHKVNNILSGLLNIDCTNYKNITKEYINDVKNKFIDNLDIFILNLATLYFADLEEYSLDQLIEILKSNDMEIFKLKNLLTEDLNIYLANTEKEIYEYSLNQLKNTFTINKITFYQDIYNNPIIKDFLNKINNFNHLELNSYNSKINDNKDNDNDNNNNNKDKDNDNKDNDNKDNDNNDNKDNDNNDNKDNKTLQFNNFELEKLAKNICDINNLEYSNLMEMKYTLWDDKIELYELKNKKTLDFLYVYFDLFKRDNKIEKDNLIYFDNKSKKICICYHFDDLINNKEYNELKNMLTNIIKLISN